MPYEGLVRMTPKGPRWTGKVILDEDKLTVPLHWKKPRRIFVNSMSDLFHEALSDEQIIKVFDVMRRCPQHTFQVLTKRAERMKDFCERLRFNGDYGAGRMWLAKDAESAEGGYRLMGGHGATGMPWVWMGVSVEDQETADERIRLLLETPASKHWVSAEPLLGPLHLCGLGGCCGYLRYGLDWVVIGGESGPGSRPFDLQWARDIIGQLREADNEVAVFVKQLGANPVFSWTENASAVGLKLGPNTDGQIYPVRLEDKKGGKITEWPKDLQVREFPKAA